MSSLFAAAMTHAPSPRDTSRIREGIVALYLFVLLGSIYLGMSAESYRSWVIFGVISALLLFGSIPVAIALILVPLRRRASFTTTTQPARPEGLTRPSIVTPWLLLAVGATLLLFVIVIGLLWPVR